MESGIDVGFGPGHDLAELVPVIDIGEVKIFNGSAGDNKTVELLVLHLIEGTVEGFHMLCADVDGDMGSDAEEGQFDLERGIGEKADDLVFRGDLGGHEVEDRDLQGTDILRGGAEFVHDEDVLRLKDFAGGKAGGDLYRHGIGFSCIFLEYQTVCLI